MADTLTANLQMTKPEPGGSEDTWGTKFNANLDALDAVFAASGGGTSVGLHVGPGKTCFVDGLLNVYGTFSIGPDATIIFPTGADTKTLDINITGNADSATNAGHADTATSAGTVSSLTGHTTLNGQAGKVPQFASTGSHLGLATVTHDWHSSVPAIDLWGGEGNKGSISGNWGAVDITQNAYYTDAGIWVAKDDGTVTQQHMVGSGIWWYIETGRVAGTQALISPSKMMLDANGGLFIAGTLSQGSDEKLKENIQPLAGTQKDRLRALRGKTYRRKGSKRQEIGLIAQEVQALLPEVVVTVEPEKKGGESYLAIDYSALTVLLIEKAQELQNRIEQLEGRP